MMNTLQSLQGRTMSSDTLTLPATAERHWTGADVQLCRFPLRRQSEDNGALDQGDALRRQWMRAKDRMQSEHNLGHHDGRLGGQRTMG